jgi:hypothetical protein
MDETDAAAIRIAVFGGGRPGVGFSAPVEAVLRKHAAHLDYRWLEVARSSQGFLMDMLEYLPKAGFVGVEIDDPAALPVTYLTDWTASATDAGSVDFVTFKETDVGPPYGHNLTYLAARHVLEGLPLDLHQHGVVLVAGPVSAPGIAAALESIGADVLRTFDATPDAFEVQGDQTGTAPVILDFTADGSDDAVSSAPADARVLLWAERIRQVIQVSQQKELPPSFTAELAQARVSG